jgi:xanthine dehydrogenase YagR molybdenum-binding subunit
MSPQPQAAVGAPLSRVDGRLKVTGQAKYAADHKLEGVVDAVVVDSSIARGRITGIDHRAAEAQPGVLKVIHHGNAPKLPYRPNPGSLNPPGERLRVFQDARVRFHGQPVAVVVATTLEAARHAASLVKIDYDAERPATDLSKAPGGGRAPDLRARRCGGGPAIRPRTAGDDVPPRPRVRDGLDGVRAPAGA